MRFILFLILFLFSSSSVIAETPIKVLSQKKTTLEDVKTINLTKRRGEFDFKNEPTESIIDTFDNRQKNRLNGKNEVFANPEGEEVPWITMERFKVKDRKQANQRILKIVFNARDGVVTYRAGLKTNYRIKRFNAIGFDIKGTTSRAKFILDCGKRKYSYEFSGITEGWKELIIPFHFFHGYTEDEVRNIEAFLIEIDGEAREVHELKGELFLDDLRLFKIQEDDLFYLEEYLEANRYEGPEQFIKLMYNKRDRI